MRAPRSWNTTQPSLMTCSAAQTVCQLLELQRADVGLGRQRHDCKGALQVLEDLLDDDGDMADMYLARRAQLTATTIASATQQRDDAGLTTAAATGQPPNVFKSVCNSLTSVCQIWHLH